MKSNTPPPLPPIRRSPAEIHEMADRLEREGLVHVAEAVRQKAREGETKTVSEPNEIP